MSEQYDPTDVTVQPTNHSPNQQRKLLFVLIGTVMLLAGVVGIVATRGGSTNRTTAAKAAVGDPLSSRVIEDRYGVRVDLVGLTGLGGLLQLRFTVVDKDKADALFHGGASTPLLEIEPSGTQLRPPVDTAHKMTIINGGSYFLFYANAGNVAHTGDKAAIVVDKVRLDGITIQS